MDNEETSKIFLEIHTDNPQEGPGLTSTTKQALEKLVTLPVTARILDVGCGPGRQTRDLQQATAGTIIALDRHEQFLKQVQARTWSKRVTAVQGDMAHLPLKDEAFDLIWSEGAIYIMGFEAGLKAWRRLLKPGGYVAVTEVTWLKPRAEAPAELRDFWQENYPEMQDVPTNVALLEEAGYAFMGQFALPEAAWWAYYEPLQERLAAMHEKYADNTAVLDILDAEEYEIELYRQHADYFGYVFYLGQKPIQAEQA